MISPVLKPGIRRVFSCHSPEIRITPALLHPSSQSLSSLWPAMIAMDDWHRALHAIRPLSLFLTHLGSVLPNRVPHAQHDESREKQQLCAAQAIQAALGESLNEGVGADRACHSGCARSKKSLPGVPPPWSYRHRRVGPPSNCCPFWLLNRVKRTLSRFCLGWPQKRNPRAT